MSALRLFSPDDAAGRPPLTARLRISEFAAAYYFPVHLLARDARPRQLEEVAQSVKYWALFTGDPPIAEIDQWHARDFVVRLKELPGKRQPTLRNNTVRKHCAAIQAILDLCGPPGPRRREALGLVPQERVPFIQRPRHQKKPAEDFFTLEEIELLMAGADAARLPQLAGCTPGDYYRRLYLWTLNTGLRIGSTMGAQAAHFRGDHLLLPGHDVVKGEHDLRVELNDHARQIAEAMLALGHARLFPWPTAWPVSRKGLYDQHELIRQCLPPARRFGFHAIRKHQNNELARINPLACQKALGHATAKVTIDSYTSRTIVAEAVRQLPQPRWRRERQARLFD